MDAAAVVAVVEQVAALEAVALKAAGVHATEQEARAVKAVAV